MGKVVAPSLEHHCNSWVVTRKSDGKVIGEFYKKENVERFDDEKVTVQTAAEHLSSL